VKQKLFAISTVQELLAPSPKSTEADAAVKPGRMVFYAGTPVYRYDFWSDTEYMLKFDMSADAVDISRMTNAPLLADHYRSIDRQVGVIDRAWLEGGKGMAEYRLAETADTETIRSKIAGGIIRQVSMEAIILESKDVTPKGSKMREYLATKWQPQAVALVPVGADPGAQLLAEEDNQAVWLAEGLYQPRITNLAETGAASQQQTLLSLLLQRRQWQ